MKIFKAIFMATAMLCSAFVHADTFQFEVDAPATSTYSMFFGLDLDDVENIELTTSGNVSLQEYSIDRLKITFPNANDLVARNFKADDSGSTFYAIVDNGWVFRKLIVELNFGSAYKPIPGDEIYVSVYVAAMEDFTNNIATPPQGEMLVSTFGMLVDVTPNPVADTHWMKMDDKGLNMKIYQRPVVDNSSANPGNGFKLYLNWMGHGERTVYLDPSLVIHEYDMYKAIALNIVTSTETTGDVYTVEVEYENVDGYNGVLQAGDLQAILDQAYEL
jgi:hypothetical protein